MKYQCQQCGIPTDGGIGPYQKMRENKQIQCLLKSCESECWYCKIERF